ncbi:MAG: sigma-70 family RNA polymerase sigma factor [Vicinamibacterales bacterium]
MSTDGPSSETVPGIVDVLSYVSLAEACGDVDGGDRLRTLLRTAVTRCLNQWAVAGLVDADARAADPPSEEVLAQVCSAVRRAAGKFEGPPDTWAAQAGGTVEAFLEQQILWVTLDWVVASMLRRCLDQWNLRSLHEHRTAVTDGVTLSEELLTRIRRDLRGEKKFVGSRTTWKEQAAARMEAFLEHRILLVTTRYCSLPRRRDVLGAERVAALLRLVSSLEDDACVSAEEQEELFLVAAAQRWDAGAFDDTLSAILKKFGVAEEQGWETDAFGQLWVRTHRSIRGAIRGRFVFADHVVDDLVGETAVRLVKAISTFDVSLSTFRAFARLIAARVVTDFLRARHGRAKADPKDERKADAAPEDTGGQDDDSPAQNPGNPRADAQDLTPSRTASAGHVGSVMSEVANQEVRHLADAVSGEDVQEASRAPGAEQSAGQAFREVQWPDDIDIPGPSASSSVDARILAQEFLQCAFESSAAFHKKLAFGFNVLHEFPAREIVAELSDVLFGVLTHRLASDYPDGAPLSESIPRLTQPLQLDLRREPSLVGKMFEAYYKGKTIVRKRAAIHDWVYDIRIQTIALMARAR